MLSFKRASLALLLSSAPAVHAWGAAGHEIVATIAQVFLTPASRAALHEILPPSTKGHLAPIASWADRVRNPYTGPLHYLNGVDDWPADHCLFGEHGWADNERNVLVGIVNSTRNLIYLDGQERDFALRYLVHFVGDMHMPLHLTGRDRGGNGDAVRWDKRITNLHSVWDNLLIAKTIRELTNYTEPLPSKAIESALRGTIYDSYVRFIVWEGILGWWREDYLTWPSCPAEEYNGAAYPSNLSSEPTTSFVDMTLGDEAIFMDEFSSQHPLTGLTPLTPRRELPTDLPLPVCPLHWAKPIHALNCNSGLIWPSYFSSLPPGTPTRHIPANELVQLDTPQYAGRIRKELVIEKLLATAGVRLAAVLNEILDPEEEAGVRVWWDEEE